MAFYLLLLLLPAALMLARCWPQRSQDRVYWIAAVVLTLFIGLRLEVGCDWAPYLVLLRIGAILPPADALAQADPAYMLLNVAAARLGLGIAVVNLFCAAVFVAGLLLFVRAQPLPHLAALMSIPVLIMVGALSATRQSVALGLLLLAMVLLVRGARAIPPLLLLLAGLFHWTAFLLLPLAVVPLIARWGVDRAALLLACAGGLALAILLWLVPSLADAIPRYEPSGGALYRAIPTALALLALLVAGNRLALTAEERAIAAWLGGVAILSFVLLPYSSTAADRLGFYVVPLQLLLLSRLPMLLPERRGRHLAAAAVALPFLVLLGGWLAMTKSQRCYLPYGSWLATPAAIISPTPPLPRPSRLCIAWLQRPHQLIDRGSLLGEPEPRTADEVREVAVARSMRKCLQVLAMRHDLDRPGAACESSMRRPSDLRALARMEKNEAAEVEQRANHRCLAALKAVTQALPHAPSSPQR